MTKKRTNVIDKHLHHPIEIIDEEVIVNSDPCTPGLIHAGRIMCRKCNIQIKWASREDIDYYRSSDTKDYDTRSLANFNQHKSATIYAVGIKDMQDSYYKKYCIPAEGTYNIYLNVSFSEKDEVKKLGAKWDQEQKKWFVNSGNYKNIVKLQKYISPKDLLKVPLPVAPTK